MATSGSRDSTTSVNKDSIPGERVELCSQDWRPQKRRGSLTSHLWEFLPEALVQLILAKLPFSSLFKCCWVCRKWRTFILSILSDEHALLCCDLKVEQLIVKRCSGGQWEQMPLQFPRRGETYCTALLASASVGGLLCFTTRARGKFLIYNPFTTRYKTLQIPGTGSGSNYNPRKPSIWNYISSSGLFPRTKFAVVGMVVNANTRGFKLIVAGCPQVFGETRQVGMTLVYDSLLDRWREVANVPIDIKFWGDPVTCHGNLYCIVHGIDISTHKLLSFKVETETWSLNPLPGDGMLMQHRSNLLLIHMTNANLHPEGYAYFQLKNPEEESPSWLPMHSVHLANVLDSITLRFPTVSVFPGDADDVKVKSLGKVNISLLGEGNVVWFIWQVYRLYGKFPREDGDYNCTVWIHNFSTNTDIVTYSPSDLFGCVYQVFKPSMQPL